MAFKKGHMGHCILAFPGQYGETFVVSTFSEASMFISQADYRRQRGRLHNITTSQDRASSDGHHALVAPASWDYPGFGTSALTNSISHSFSVNGNPPGAHMTLIGDTHHIITGVPSVITHSPPGTTSPDTISPTMALASPNGYWTGDMADQSYYRESAPRMASIDSSSDSYRKKNAKIDVPEGRTLENLDDLIAAAQEEDLIRELKAQKRLLKNREAALQSRQRKKQHTENLEGEKKQFMHIINQYENKLALVTTTNAQLTTDKLNLQQDVHRAHKRLHELEADNNKLRSQLMSYQENMQPNHMTPPTTGGASISNYTEVSEDLAMSPFQPDWSGMIDSPRFASPHDLTSIKHEGVGAFSITERLRPPHEHDTDQLYSSSSDAYLLMLILLATGASVASSPSPDTLTAIKKSGVLDDIRASSYDVVDLILSKSADIDVTSARGIDQVSVDLIKMILANVKSEATRKIRAMLRSAAASKSSSAVASSGSAASGKRRK